MAVTLTRILVLNTELADSGLCDTAFEPRSCSLPSAWRHDLRVDGETW
jgi:hypothetical protein